MAGRFVGIDVGSRSLEVAVVECGYVLMEMPRGRHQMRGDFNPSLLRG